MSNSGNITDKPLPKIAFVCPRLHEPGTVGGAETLLYNMARDAAKAGCSVSFLTTCAKNHFTWKNELPEETFSRDGMTVRRFKVNESRNEQLFLELQAAICRDETLTDEEESAWMRNSVNSDGLTDFIGKNYDSFDRIIAGPYLFGLVEAVARLFPEKAMLVPCLHNESFAKTRVIEDMFKRVYGFLFNTETEKQLAFRLYGGLKPEVSAVVAMGMEPFEVGKKAFAEKHGISSPYVIYSGRREPLKGTPILMDYLDLFRGRTGRDIKFVMTGSGTVDIPPALKDHVIDLGFVSEQEKREAMAGAVAFCHPSVNESLGIVLLEAWLARTPALVHAKGEVLRNQCAAARGGLWFRDYPEFEEELKLLMDNPELNAGLAANGHEFAIRMYSPEAVLARFIDAVK